MLTALMEDVVDDVLRRHALEPKDVVWVARQSIVEQVLTSMSPIGAAHSLQAWTGQPHVRTRLRNAVEFSQERQQLRLQFKVLYDVLADDQLKAVVHLR